MHEAENRTGRTDCERGAIYARLLCCCVVGRDLAAAEATEKSEAGGCLSNIWRRNEMNLCRAVMPEYLARCGVVASRWCSGGNVR